MLKIEKLNFSYNNKRILQRIDLYLEAREFIGIIGPNGSGKTTLLKNISRVLSPDSGAIYLNSKLMHSYKPLELARFMAVVPQDTTVNYNFTVYDLIMMGRNPYQDRWGRVKEEDIQIVEEAMELTDSSRFRDRMINELSGGERQRVIIARALAQQPRLLLLDEPTASLDINYQGEIFDLLRSLNKELELTVLVVSHDLNLSSQYCSKLVLLKEGEIYRTGSPEEVLTPDNIRNVYHTEVIVKDNPLTGRPYIILIPGEGKSRAIPLKERIHLICGGGSGREMIRELSAEGYNLSCGVLNQGDSDWEAARRLDVKTVTIPPFSYIDEKSLSSNRELLEESRQIIICETPFGRGNLDNLSQALEIEDKKIIVINSRPFAERDYTGGEAGQYWARLLKKDNVISVQTAAGALEQVRKLNG